MKSPRHQVLAPGRQQLSLRSASICDQLMVGTEQSKVREAIRVQGLKVSEGSRQGKEWEIEELGVQCKLWFDDNSVLKKKKKILVTE